MVQAINPESLIRRSANGLAGRDLALAPLNQLDRFTRQGGTEPVYVATGDDPQAAVMVSEGAAWKPGPGLFLVHLRADVIAGALESPCLYIDRGGGYTARDCQRFLRYGPSDWLAFVDVSEPVAGIRLDPSVRPFTARKLEVRYVSGEEEPAIHQTGTPGVWLRKRLKRLCRKFGLSPVKGYPRERPATASPLAADTMFAAFDTEYAARLETAMKSSSIDYVPLRQESPPPQSDVKLIAYYLPQFHPIAENDAWWGKGFTEWTNVSKAVAQYEGHYQPRLPGELGFYDLRLSEVLHRQVELARLHGVHAFCFHFYWFAGKRLLERPLDQFLAVSRETGFPFCLCWANENWTRRWDGLENEVLIAQDYARGQAEALLKDLLVYVTHPNYITVEGKPVLLIYRADSIPHVERFVRTLRRKAKAAGLPGLHLVATNAFASGDPVASGFDAMAEFPPHGTSDHLVDHACRPLHMDFRGRVVSYSAAAAGVVSRYPAVAKRRPALYPGVMPQWDNTARRLANAFILHGSTPAQYGRWLHAAAHLTRHINPPDRRFVFVNAWNEWAEGAYLEPDRRFGYAYLEATSRALAQMADHRAELSVLVNDANARGRKRCDTAIVLHLYFEELIGEFHDRLAQIGNRLRADVLLSVPEHWSPRAFADAISAFQPARVTVVENRGRDVLPFLGAHADIVSMGYRHACKVHSKRSQHRVDGDGWRHRLLDGLLSHEALDVIERRFIEDSQVGLAAPEASFVYGREELAYASNAANCEALSRAMGLPFRQRDFVAGTMFWFRPEALKRLSQLQSISFEPELGQTDGTTAHALERLFPALVEEEGYQVLRY